MIFSVLSDVIAVATAFWLYNSVEDRRSDGTEKLEAGSSMHKRQQKCLSFQQIDDPAYAN